MLQAAPLPLDACASFHEDRLPLPLGEETRAWFTRRSPSAECGTAIRLTGRTCPSTFVLYEHSEQTETHVAPTGPWPAQLCRPAQAPTPLRWSAKTITRLDKTVHLDLTIPHKTLDLRRVPRAQENSPATPSTLFRPWCAFPFPNRQNHHEIAQNCTTPISRSPAKHWESVPVGQLEKKFPCLARSVVHRAALRPHATRTPPNGSEQDRTFLPNRRPNPTEQSRTPPNASNVLLAAPQTPTRRSTCLGGSWS